jgi:integrase
MASLSRDSNGTSRVQFVGGDGRRRAIRLGKVPAKVAESVLRRVEQLVAAAIAGTPHDADLSAWLAAVPPVLYRRLVRVGLAVPRAEDVAAPVVTLDHLCRAFKERAAVKPITAMSYDQTLDSLRAFYGLEKPIEEITTESADEWRIAIAQAAEGEGKRRKKRMGIGNRLAPATVAKRIHVAKRVFGKAVAWGWLEKNPFSALRAGSQANPARAHYVDLAVAEAVLQFCPSIEWRLVFALCRLAGLRCPSEVGGLTWADVDFTSGRLTVRSPKTEHHGGQHAVRVVPIVPRLREILAAARDAAAPGESLVVPMAARSGANLRTTLEKIIARAGVEPWPRLMQNLRASCETDWVEKYPAHECARWMGHSPTIAARHYLQSRDHHFRDAVENCAASSGQSGAAAVLVPSGAESGAESGARAAHFQAQHPPATDGKKSQARSRTEITPAKSEVSSGVRKKRRKVLVGDEGLEPPTPSV